MSYWQIVLLALDAIGIAAVVIAYIWAMVYAFMDDHYRLVGWLMVIALFAAFIFGVPWLIMVTA